MTTTRKLIVTVLACAGLALTAVPALAYKGGCDPMDGSMMGDPGTRSERMKERMEVQQELLHKNLKLTSEQEPAWQAFVAKTGSRSDWKRPDPAVMVQLTAPERMEKMLEMSKQHQVLMTERLEALKTFYAVLTPEQKKVLDQHFVARRGGKGPR